VSRGDAERIGDIWDRIIAARTAEAYLVAAESVEDNGLMGVAFDAILYDLLVIGEAVKALSRECRERHPGVPWTRISGMRDVLAHDYFRIRTETVRRTMDQPLTVLEDACMHESTA
jgi:uncharacterized protein with HEPN domain